MEKQFPELERPNSPVSPEQPGSLPEGGVVKPAKSFGVEIGLTDGDEGRLLPDELEVAPVSVLLQDAQQAVAQKVELDPIGGAQAVWEQVHRGQVVLTALAYHKVNGALTDLKRATEQ
ncbi:MAG: hypothetical protein WC400_02770 [Patescibacteria group bacterium]|jgi:hypothetical protein